MLKRRVSSLETFALFGFVRNPWDRMASAYHYLVEKRRTRADIPRLGGFEEFVQRAYNGDTWLYGLALMRPQVDFFAGANGVFREARIGHYERLADDLEYFANRLGFQVALAHRNRSSNSGHDYLSLYTDQLVDQVAELFRKDVATFGYAFGVSGPPITEPDRLW